MTIRRYPDPYSRNRNCIFLARCGVDGSRTAHSSNSKFYNMRVWRFYFVSRNVNRTRRAAQGANARPRRISLSLWHFLSRRLSLFYLGQPNLSFRSRSTSSNYVHDSVNNSVERTCCFLLIISFGRKAHRGILIFKHVNRVFSIPPKRQCAL
jgi:hypothetical protein